MDKILKAKLDLPVYYFKGGCFIYSARNGEGWTYETCKELACSVSNYDGYGNLSYVIKDSKNFLARIREYEALLGLPHTSFQPIEVVWQFTDLPSMYAGVRLSGFLERDVVTKEVAAILLKTVKVEILLDNPADINSLVDRNYFRSEKIKSIFCNLPKFLDGITPGMLELCRYDFSGEYNHGGLLNWTSEGIFDEILKQFDKQPEVK